MRLSLTTGLLGFLPFCLSLATTTITLHIPPSQQLPNPNALPPSTHATLSTLHATYAAPLSVANTFVFHNVSAGSYLADVHTGSFGFAPLRIDVLGTVDGSAGDDVRLSVAAWETFRGNDWANKGEMVKEGAGGGFAVRCLGKKIFFQDRGTFSPLSLLKNPMILMGLVSMGIFFGMPKLMENMDPEMRAEWEESQKKNPVNSLMAGGQAGANPIGNFDMAAYLSGAGKKEEEGSSGAGSAGNSGNGGKKGNKK